VTDRVEECIIKFFSSKNKRELFEQGMKRGIRIAPVNDVKDISESPQLAARDYWIKTDHPELSASVVYPGPFTKFSETPLEIRHRAPLIGEHNHDIYEVELGFSSDEISILRQKGVI
jgi:crotonobetainyl-CoA:carnitine CoA-transferase CaiB-like acyl-CoA transferase